jgi:hypothetical protein
VVRPAAGGQAVYEDSRRDRPAPTEVAVNRAADRAAGPPPGRTAHPCAAIRQNTRVILTGIARYWLRADVTGSIGKARSSLLMGPADGRRFAISVSRVLAAAGRSRAFPPKRSAAHGSARSPGATS